MARDAAVGSLEHTPTRLPYVLKASVPRGTGGSNPSASDTSDEQEHWPQFTRPGSAVLGGTSVWAQCTLTPSVGLIKRMS
jgi:hypothetical protein